MVFSRRSRLRAWGYIQLSSWAAAPVALGMVQDHGSSIHNRGAEKQLRGEGHTNTLPKTAESWGLLPTTMFTGGSAHFPAALQNLTPIF